MINSGSSLRPEMMKEASEYINGDDKNPTERGWLASDSFRIELHLSDIFSEGNI